MDGISAMRAIREFRNGLPASRGVVAEVSVHALPEDRHRFLPEGIDEIFSKPLAVNSLARMLLRFAG